MLKYLILIVFISTLQSQYTVVNKTQGSTFIKLYLNYTGIHQYYVKPKSKISKQLVFHFQALTYSDFTFKIYDPNKKNFQVPQGGIFPQDPKANFTFPLSNTGYNINYTMNHFGFCITRKSNDAVIFDSSVVEIEFSEYYIQFGTILDSKTLFGYSERNTLKFKLQPGTWTLWNREEGAVLDNGQALNSKQKSGYYPAYLTRQSKGLHHIGYYRSSSAIDVEVQSFSNTSYLKIYRAIGGIIDMRFMIGDQNPQDCLKTFHNLLGPSTIPPFWALGYHQSRWGYQDINALLNVIKNFQSNNIPLDTIWNDMDYYSPNNTFTFNTFKFPLDKLKQILKNYYYIPIVQVGIRYNKGYAYQQGIKRNVFIKDASKNNYVGQMDTGKCLFTDFFHPNATNYWKDMLQYLYNQVQFSGLWLDANQITQDCDGPCQTPTGQIIIDYPNDIPYTPGGGSIQKTLISLNATHFGSLQQANVHTLHSIMHQYNTYQFLKDKKRPFILSSGSSLGSNRYAFHWSGDNYANFTFIKSSIISNFMFGLWGIQMIGSDICGFSGNTTEQVCSRFYQLGALYPFSRNHNQISSKSQQPYALGSIVLQASRKNLKLRYSLLKFYYKQFIIRKGVGTIFRPVYYEFYRDQNLLRDEILETQFLIGKSMMSAPILQEGKISRTVYFPCSFYNFYTGQHHAANSIGIIQNKLTDLVPLFVREGYAVFTQQTQIITKTRQLGNLFNFVCGLQYSSSTSTDILYTCSGDLLSLSDYERQQHISACLSQNCHYQITANLKVTKLTQQKQLNLIWAFSGKAIQFEQRITKLSMYTEQQVINFTPSQQISIYGTDSKTFKFK